MPVHSRDSRLNASIALAANLLVPVVGFADPDSAHVCPDSIARVSAESAVDRRDACAGAADAIRFFAQLGLPPIEAPSIVVTASLPVQAGPSAAGAFLEQHQRSYILSYARFKAMGTWLGVRIDRRMYRSLAAHETAHALADHHFTIPWPTIQAKEYVAYVAMFCAMEPHLRVKALRATPGTGFANEAQITELLYLFDPMRFGAEAYRHFIKSEVGPPFVKAILEGKALLD